MDSLRPYLRFVLIGIATCVITFIALSFVYGIFVYLAMASLLITALVLGLLNWNKRRDNKSSVSFLPSGLLNLTKAARQWERMAAEGQVHLDRDAEWSGQADNSVGSDEPSWLQRSLGKVRFGRA